MAKTKSSPGANARKLAADTPDPKARTKEQIQEVRNRVTNVILDGSVDMARRVVQAVAEGGQITTLKYLWETAGLFPGGDESDSGESDSLAKILLERMGLSPDMPEEDAESEA